MAKEKLYKVDDPKKLRFGVTPDSHVAHILNVREEAHGSNLYEEDKDLNDIRMSGYGPVPQEEVFTNKSTVKTAALFRKLVERSDRDYDLYQDDPVMARMLCAVRDYVTADSRRSQQTALKMLKIQLKTCRATLRKNSKIENDIHKRLRILETFKKLDTTNIDKYRNDSMFGPVCRTLKHYKKAVAAGDKAEIARTKAAVKKHLDILIPSFEFTLESYEGSAKKLEALQFYEGLIKDLQPEGSLKIPDDHVVEPEFIKDPENTIYGTIFGHWTRTDDELFPHDPSPTDVKQGLGLQTCFMLSVLTQKAAKDPQFIKDCMKDNGNGTVTVRFMHRSSPKADPVPVYIDVQKTVMKNRLTGANIYSSSSLWVQMMEKAYAKYLEEYHESDKVNAKGMQKVDCYYSDHFMTALTGEQHSQSLRFSPVFGFTDQYYTGKNRPQPVQRPEGEDHYTIEEKSVFSRLDEYVNRKNAMVTVSASAIKGRHTESDCHSVGIRTGHAYTVTKVFTLETEAGPRCFVQLRDPYAMFEAGHDRNKKLINGSDIIRGSRKAGLSNMGTFNMELSEFFDYYTDLCGPRQLCDDLQQDRIKKWPGYSEFYKENAQEENKISPESKKPEDGKISLEDEQPEDNQIILDQDEPDKPVKDEIKTDEIIDTTSPKEKKQPSEADKKLLDELGFANMTEDDMIEKPDNEPVTEAMELFRDDVRFVRFRNEIRHLANDLASTDSAVMRAFYNTNEFGAMRDAVYDLNRFIQTARKNPGKPAEKAFDEKLRKVQETTAAYIEAKCRSVNQELDKGKEPSKTAILRLTAASMLESVCDMQAVQLPYRHQKEDQVAVLAEDMCLNLNSEEAMDVIRKNPQRFERMKKTAAAIVRYGTEKPGTALASGITPVMTEKLTRFVEENPPVKKGDVIDELPEEGPGQQDDDLSDDGLIFKLPGQ